MDDFAELGLEGLNKTTDKFFDKTYDAVHRRHPPRYNRGEASRNTMSAGRGHDRGYDSDSDDSYNERVRRRRARRDDDRDNTRHRQYDSPPGQTYQPRNYDTQPPYQPPYQPYRPLGAAPGAQPNPQYYDDTPRPSSRDYASSTGTGPQGGAVLPYTRQPDRDRERSRPRRQRRSPSRDSRRYSRSRSRSRSRDFDDNPLMAFDRSGAGIGAGIAGALVGGYLGREVSDRHQKRGAALGAILGGIGANLIENRVRIYRDEMKDEQREASEKWEAKHGNGQRRRRQGSPMRY